MFPIPYARRKLDLGALPMIHETLEMIFRSAIREVIFITSSGKKEGNYDAR